jgi:tRNA(Ile)-lysidine synthase
VRADTSHLDVLAGAVETPLDVPTLLALPPALRSRALRRTALAAGADASTLTAAHLAELDRLVTDWHGQRRIELPGGVACVREGDSLSYVVTPVGG